jgi:hypothetical protein
LTVPAGPVDEGFQGPHFHGSDLGHGGAQLGIPEHFYFKGSPGFFFDHFRELGDPDGMGMVVGLEMSDSQRFGGFGESAESNRYGKNQNYSLQLFHVLTLLFFLSFTKAGLYSFTEFFLEFEVP